MPCPHKVKALREMLLGGALPISALPLNSDSNFTYSCSCQASVFDVLSGFCNVTSCRDGEMCYDVEESLSGMKFSTHVENQHERVSRSDHGRVSKVGFISFVCFLFLLILSPLGLSM